MDESVDFTQGQQEIPQAVPLWDYAVAQYRRPGVAEACLALQDDYGADVLLLLCAAYMAARGVALSAEVAAELEACAADLRSQLVEPLRRLRKGQRPPPGADGEQRAVYEALKAAELLAERWQFSRLAAALPPGVGNASAGETLLADNLAAIVGPGGRVPAEKLAALAERLG